MKSLQVFLKERSYPIFIGKDILFRIGRLLKDRKLTARQALIVSQQPIAALYAAPLMESLEREGFETASFITPPFKSSEHAKSQSVYLKLIRRLAAVDGRKRSIFLVALGGGVVGDLTGFAASVYRRGIPYAQIPTTLTAQVDSAIGGKTGIDLPEGKNLLGSIHQPVLVLSDLSILNSLPERHWVDGFAEIIKYGVIKDPSLFFLLERHGLEKIRNDHRTLEDVVTRCSKIKARIVEKDEWDKKDMRIILNFGHTAGHAIEAASRFSRNYTHGEAVAIGMLIACDISRRLGCLRDAALPERLEKVLVKFGLPIHYKNLSTETLLKSISYDKKTVSGVNRFVLPVSLGKTRVVGNIPSDKIRQALVSRKG